MGCASSYPAGDVLEALAAATVTGAGVAAYQVTSAGTDKVNGLYIRHGCYRGYPVFKKDDNIWLMHHVDSWVIADKSKFDSNGTYDGNFYILRDEWDTNSRSHLPRPIGPQTGWQIHHAGADPPPSLTPILEGPAAYAVQGAGTAAANGVYLRDGMHDGSPMYRHEDGKLVVVRAGCNSYRWYIGEYDKLWSGSEEGDLYRTESATEYPPTGDAWTVGGDDYHNNSLLQGVAPPPTLTAIAADGDALHLQWRPLEAQVASPMHVPIAIPTAAAAAIGHAPNFEPTAYMTTSTTTTTTTTTTQVM